MSYSCVQPILRCSTIDRKAPRVITLQKFWWTLFSKYWSYSFIHLNSWRKDHTVKRRVSRIETKFSPRLIKHSGNVLKGFHFSIEPSLSLVSHHFCFNAYTNTEASSYQIRIQVIIITLTVYGMHTVTDRLASTILKYIQKFFGALK
jgi:hypothetical protein